MGGHHGFGFGRVRRPAGRHGFGFGRVRQVGGLLAGAPTGAVHSRFSLSNNAHVRTHT